MTDLETSVDEAAVAEHRRLQNHRTGRLVSAWLTILPSKGLTLLVQLIAIPTVYRAIGPAQFSAYAAVTAAVSILGFLNLGMEARWSRHSLRPQRIETTCANRVLSLPPFFLLPPSLFLRCA